MKLIGSQQFDPAPGDHSLYADVLGRLPKELGNTGDRLRFVGYEAVSRRGACVRFIGAEVGPAARIPQNRMAWELDAGTWTIRNGAGDDGTVEWKEDIAWHWRDTGRDSGATGEFLAHGPADWHWDGLKGEVKMVAHAWFAADGRSPQDDVLLADYNPHWPEQFCLMADWLRDGLGPEIALRIEHYGSTAIPGMPAKPVVDVLIEVPSFPEAKRRAIPLLNSPLWEYWWYSDHMVFIKRTEFLGPREFHVHLAPQGHAIWKGLVLRDHLRADNRDAKRYADLKHALASAHHRDREAYTAAKQALVNEITEKAGRAEA